MKNKKMIAPIVIAVIMIIYFILYFVFIINVIKPTLLFIILGAVIPISIIGVIIYVALQRIEEIKGGEEDDLSKYWLYYR